MSDYTSFDQKYIDAAIEAASRHNDSIGFQSDASEIHPHAANEFAISAGCVEVAVKNGKVCLNLPLGIGSFCLPVPSWIPEGANVKACIDICTKFGIPTGLKLSVSFNGTIVFTKTFLLC